MSYNFDGESALVANMRAETDEMDTFPVLLGDEVAHFHDVRGGYNRDGSYDVVNLIHRVQAVGSPYRVNVDELSHSIEAHLKDNFYNLSVDGIRVDDDYPNKDYILSLKVNSTMSGEYSFSKPLSAGADKREEWHDYERSE